jgi:hypothetical protein
VFVEGRGPTLPAFHPAPNHKTKTKQMKEDKSKNKADMPKGIKSGQKIPAVVTEWGENNILALHEHIAKLIIKEIEKDEPFASTEGNPRAFILQTIEKWMLDAMPTNWPPEAYYVLAVQRMTIIMESAMSHYNRQAMSAIVGGMPALDNLLNAIKDLTNPKPSNKIPGIHPDSFGPGSPFNRN